MSQHKLPLEVRKARGLVGKPNLRRDRDEEERQLQERIAKVTAAREAAKEKANEQRPAD